MNIVLNSRSCGNILSLKLDYAVVVKRTCDLTNVKYHLRHGQLRLVRDSTLRA